MAARKKRTEEPRIVVKHLTPDLREAYNRMQDAGALVAALKTGFFVRKSTMVNAYIAYERIRARFWVAVGDQWPEYAGWEKTVQAGYEITMTPPKL